MDRLQTLPIVLSDLVYLRLIGDRRLADDFPIHDTTILPQC
jgi:hypothetical protein